MPFLFRSRSFGPNPGGNLNYILTCSTAGASCWESSGFKRFRRGRGEALFYRKHRSQHRPHCRPKGRTNKKTCRPKGRVPPLSPLPASPPGLLFVFVRPFSRSMVAWRASSPRGASAAVSPRTKIRRRSPTNARPTGRGRGGTVGLIWTVVRCNCCQSW